MLENLVISPSQQPHNQYTGEGTGIADSEQAWMGKLADKVKKRVDAQGWGITCRVIKEGSVGGQVRKSNVLDATEHVALHTNAGGAGATGTLLIHYPGSKKGASLARALFAAISPASDNPDVGIWANAKYYETRETHAPAVIVEYAFHDRADEAAEIRRSLDEFAEATVKGLAAYSGRAYKAPGTKPPAPPATPLPARPMPLLRRGSVGGAVRTLQAALNKAGASPRLAVDGVFGPRTLTEVKDFQRKKRLVVDGIVGPRTWKALGY
jgi:hypothetical protein